jgi:hypothetical protein
MTNELKDHLDAKYGKITMKSGDEFAYLGMQVKVDREKKTVVISMPKLRDDILDGYSPGGIVSYPMKAESVRNDDTVLVSTEKQEHYRSIVAKILYFSKRARPDLLFAVSVLCTKVQSVTNKDYEAMERLMNYIYCSKDQNLTLYCGEDLKYRVWVDAAYGIHGNYRSHTGIVIKLGGAVVYACSRKQKLNTLSSTESQLVAICEAYCATIWIVRVGRFLGIKEEPLIFYEDNMPVINMLDRGYSASSNSRHIDIRFFFLCDKIRNGEVIVKHVTTDKQLADVLTKAVTGGDYERMANQLMNAPTGGVGDIFNQDSSQSLVAN